MSWRVRVREGDHRLGGLESLYICTYKLRLVAGDPLVEEKFPVTFYYATKFKTKHEAINTAILRGYTEFDIRTPTGAYIKHIVHKGDVFVKVKY